MGVDRPLDVTQTSAKPSYRCSTNTTAWATPEVTWEDGDKVRVSLVYERTLPSAPQNVS